MIDDGSEKSVNCSPSIGWLQQHETRQRLSKGLLPVGFHCVSPNLQILRICFVLLLAVSGAIALSSCQRISVTGNFGQLNSRYSDEQPALSGDGRYIAFLSNRRGRQELALYDLQQNQPVSLPPLSRRGRLIESPSLSHSAHYLVYLVNERGRPHIELYDRIRQQRQILTFGNRHAIRNPSISADGRYVAFEQSHNGQWDIQVLDRGTGIKLDMLGRSPDTDLVPNGAPAEGQ